MSCSLSDSYALLNNREYARCMPRQKETVVEFKSVVKDTKSNTKNITKSISIHSDYQLQGEHFW